MCSTAAMDLHEILPVCCPKRIMKIPKMSAFKTNLLLNIQTAKEAPKYEK
jgi:hypothetical protein